MLRKLFVNNIEGTQARMILDYGIYYPIIIIAITLCLFLAYRRISTLGYDKKKVRNFFIIILSTFYPIIFFSTRLANMFYHPYNTWSFDFFLNQSLQGNFITFHSGIYLPFILGFSLSIIMKMKPWQIADVFFLYLPLGHAIGRVACFLVGCCWGNMVTIQLLGKYYSFQNPVPLYSIFLNILIFLVLKVIYEKKITHEENKNYSGIITSMYLILYGNIRLLLELIRTEKKVAWGLTQAQIVMIIFIATGAVLFISIMLKNSLITTTNDNSKKGVKKKYLYSIIGFIAFYLITSLLAKYVLENNIITWPFRRTENLTQAIFNIIRYSPFFLFALTTLIFLKASGLKIKDSFTAGINWKKMSPAFYIGLGGSIIYSFFLLLRVKFGLNKLSYWFPVIILCALNAFAEEAIFRMVLYRISQKLIEQTVISNLLQSFFYSAFHFFIGGTVFGVAAFFYGIVLGIIFEKHKSILPCILCHFIIDLGAIGAPILSG